MSNRKPKLCIRLRRIHSTLEAAKQLIEDLARDAEPLDEHRVVRISSILTELDYCIEASKDAKWRPRYADKIGDLYYQGLTDAQIAAKVGCSDGGVGSWRKYRELPPNKEPRRLALEKKRQELYDLGWIDREIAEAIGHKPCGVTSWRFRNNLKANYKKHNPAKKCLTKRGKRV